MKKIVIAVLLIAAICVPAFATSIVTPAFGLSATVSFDEGFGLEGLGAFGKVVYAVNDDARVEAKGEFKVSLVNDAKVTGFYFDVLGGYYYKGTTFQGGFGSDFHMIDGKLVANVGSVAGVTFDVHKDGEKFAVTSATARYNFINKTGASAFTMNYGAGFLF